MSALHPSRKRKGFTALYDKVQHTAANGIPLGAEVNEKYFKTFFLDVGLVTSILELNVLNFSNIEELNLVNSGKISEQFISQHLYAAKQLFEHPSLCYWSREKKSAAAEIDFVISSNNKIIPIEVKSGSSGSLKSLHVFLQEKNLDLGVKFCSNLPSLVQEQFTSAKGNKKQYQLLSLPLYMVEELNRLLDSQL